MHTINNIEYKTVSNYLKLNGLTELNKKDRNIIGLSFQEIIRTLTQIESKVDISYQERAHSENITVLEEDDQITVEELIENIKHFIETMDSKNFSFVDRDLRTSYRNIKRSIINLTSSSA
jgi:hypothetical protein